jgi:hypothetical protein
MKPNLAGSAYNDVGLMFCDEITYIDKGLIIFLITEHHPDMHDKLLTVY